METKAYFAWRIARATGGELMTTGDKPRLYALEERVYGDIADAVRRATVSQERKRQWMDEAMSLLVRAQDLAALREYDLIEARLDALELVIRAAD